MKNCVEIPQCRQTIAGFGGFFCLNHKDLTLIGSNSETWHGWTPTNLHGHVSEVECQDLLFSELGVYGNILGLGKARNVFLRVS